MKQSSHNEILVSANERNKKDVIIIKNKVIKNQEKTRHTNLIAMHLPEFINKRLC